jgi:hypothetical protein
MTQMLQTEPHKRDMVASIWAVARVAFRQIAVMADMYLTVLGSAIVALAAVVLLDGFDIVRLGMTNTTGGMLATSIVIAVVGLFMLGIASEGPLRGEGLETPEVNLVVARVLATLLVCVVGLWAASALASVSETTTTIPLDGPFSYVITITRAVAVAGIFVVSTMAVPASWLLRRTLPSSALGWDRLMILAVWFLAAFVLLRQAITG